MTKPNNGGPALSSAGVEGMTLRDYFAGQALANSAICTGQSTEYYLNQWFGNRTSISSHEIAVAQSYEIAGAMLRARDK